MRNGGSSYGAFGQGQTQPEPVAVVIQPLPQEILGRNRPKHPRGRSVAEGTAMAGRHLAGKAAAVPCGACECGGLAACRRALRWRGRLGCLRAHVRYVGWNLEVNTDAAQPENNPLF